MDRHGRMTSKEENISRYSVNWQQQIMMSEFTFTGKNYYRVKKPPVRCKETDYIGLAVSDISCLLTSNLVKIDDNGNMRS